MKALKWIVLILVAVPALFAAASTARAQQAYFYFRQDWCPDDYEVDAILDNFVIERNGCCIQEAKPRFFRTGEYRELLARWKDKLIDDPSRESCTGSPASWSAEDKARIAAIRVEKDRREEEVRRAWDAAQAEKDRAAADAWRAQVESLLADMPSLSKDGACAVYGTMLRTGDKKVADTARRIASKRAIRIDEAMAKQERIRIGISECQLFASFGLPERANRSVGSWGVHVQYIYGRTYVYTKNGAVTSWQD